MDNGQAGKAMDKPPAEEGGTVRPSVQAAKETAAGIKRVGIQGNRGVKPGSVRGPYTKAPQPAAPPPVAPAEIPPFIWNEKDISLILGAPFTFGYAIGGPDHDHWRTSGAALEQSECFKKFAYVINRIGVRDPLYLILGVACVEYLGVIGKCTVQSMRIRQDKRAKKERESDGKSKMSPM